MIARDTNQTGMLRDSHLARFPLDNSPSGAGVRQANALWKTPGTRTCTGPDVRAPLIVRAQLAGYEYLLYAQSADDNVATIS